MKELLEQIKHDGAEDWQGVVYALECGEYLDSAGIADQDAIEDLHAYALAMVAGGAAL